MRPVCDQIWTTRLVANIHLKHNLNRKNNRDRINIGIPQQAVKLVISIVPFGVGSKSAKHKRGWTQRVDFLHWSDGLER